MEVAINISAVIITYNEEHNLKDCINSLKGLCNEIIVVDAHSTDNTLTIAKSLGAKVYSKKWESYGDQRNFGATQATNNWVLSIDADERVDSVLARELTQIKFDQHCVYALNVKTNYLGKWIKYCGWYPNYKKRLYNRKVVKWSDDLVHENLISDGRMDIIKIKGNLLHYSYPTIDIHHLKTERYAKLTAQNWKKKKRSPGIAKKMFGPSFRFFRTYILKLGILDGREGYMISKMSALLVRKQLEYFYKIKD